MERGAGTLKGRRVLQTIRDRSRDAADPSFAIPCTVVNASGSLVMVAVADDDNPTGGRLLATAANQKIDIGDTGVLIPLRGGGYVFLRTGGFQGVQIKDTGVSAATNIYTLDFRNGIYISAASGSEVDVSLDYGVEGAYDGYFGQTKARGTLELPARLDHWHGNTDLMPVGGGGSGRCLSLGGMSALGALVGVTATANRCYYVPFFCPAFRDFDAVLYEITTAVSGSVQVGIYECQDNSLLPGDRVAMSSKTAQSTTGVKTQTFTAVELHGGKWYWAAIAGTTANAYRGSSTAANLPNHRGFTTTLTDVCCMLFEDLAGGWTNIPSVASASTVNNLYIHLGSRIV